MYISVPLSMAGRKNYASLEDLQEYHYMITQTFKSEDDAFKFYNSYAESKGFSVRRDRVKRAKPSQEIIGRRFLCACQGFRTEDNFNRANRVREPRALSRCGCTASFDVELCEDTGVWFVKGFNDIHDHPLVLPQHSHVLWSHRHLNNAQKAEAVELGLGGLRTYQIMDVMERNYGGAEQTGFLLRDLYNFFSRERKKRIKGRDAEFVLKIMEERKAQDVDFFYKYSVDDQGRLKNLFWSDAKSKIDYNVFGDVVVFDSTYRVNRYNLPFVPFIGVNHHRSTVVFGCGLLSDETTPSYVWMLEAFMEAMQQKRPNSVITDGDSSMARAIEIVLPGVDHRLCSWHIEQNMIKYLRGKKLREFRKFVYHAMDVAEFERLWIKFKEDHKIRDDNLWFWRMYQLRKKWSAAYTKGRRFLGMQSNQRSESLNSKLHKHLDRKMSVVDLVVHYEFCLSRIRRTEFQLDGKASASIPFTNMGADVFEERASRLFTPTIFKKVRKQIAGLGNWVVTEVSRANDCITYVVASKERYVHQIMMNLIFDGHLMVNGQCECRLLECEDIPCQHIFAVLRSMQVHILPDWCVKRRWTTKAKIGFPSDRGNNIQVWSEQMGRYRALRNKANLALFKLSWSVDETERAMDYFEDILARGDEDYDIPKGASYGPVPAHFSAANEQSSNTVQDPKKIITKGAPPKKRLKTFRETLQKKHVL